MWLGKFRLFQIIAYTYQKLGKMSFCVCDLSKSKSAIVLGRSFDLAVK